MHENDSSELLAVNLLSKTYGDFKAVDGASFYVNKGEIVGLLGPNGAGKTTITNIIAGLLEPTSGEIKIFGKDFPQRKKEILPFMNFAAAYAQLPGNLRVYENLLIYAMLYGVSLPRERVASIIHEFELDKFMKIKTGFLSSGEQSRVVLAKAILNNPKLLLLDEPTASLDPHTSQHIRSHIKKYARENESSLLWTSHDMYEIEEVCDRVLFLSHGKIILEGSPRELPAKYGKKNLEELFIMIAREPLSIHNHPIPIHP